MHNTSRTRSLFDDSSFREENFPVHIVGCGVVNSRVALELAGIGVSSMILHDADTVSEANVGPQMYRRSQIGQKKVDALQDLIYDKFNLLGYPEADDILVTKSDSFVDKTTSLGGVVFLGVDSMNARREIFGHCLKNQPHSQMMFEVRMAETSGRVYAIDPRQTDEANAWEVNSDYEGEPPAETACQQVTSAGPMAGLLSSAVVIEFKKWYNEYSGGKKRYTSETYIETEPILTVRTRDFRELDR